MINREIYTLALHLLAQHQISEDTADFEERAPYLLAACCIEAQALDTALRKSLGQSVSYGFTGVCLDLEAPFPLHQSFASLAGFYLAAMLIVDEDGELSDKLYAHYCDGLASVQSRLEKADQQNGQGATSVPDGSASSAPWTVGSIEEAYFYD